MKKPKKTTKWIVLNKTFNTFKEFKNFAWYNMRPNEVTTGVELFEDTIYKEYKITKKERRLIIEKTYRLRNGSKINLPIYYRNQLFTEEEKEALFLDKIEKGIIYVMGQKVHRDDEEYYLQLLNEGRKTEYRLYGYNVQNWEEQKYLSRLRRQKKRQDKALKQLETYWTIS